MKLEACSTPQIESDGNDDQARHRTPVLPGRDETPAPDGLDGGPVEPLMTTAFVQRDRMGAAFGAYPEFPARIR